MENVAEILQVLLLFIIVLVAFYAAIKIFANPPKLAKSQNFIAVLPTLVGVTAFLLARFVLPLNVNDGLWMYQLLAANLMPTFMVLFSFILLLKLKTERNEQ